MNVVALYLISLIPTQGTAVLDGNDPIDMIEGRIVSGSASFSTNYLRHEYRFCSAEHLAAFKKNPTRYAVQNGGACGKMGALTGKGSPNRWAVANGKIYLFASDGCKTAFLENLDQYTAPVKAPASGTDEDQRRANAIFEQMQNAHGAKTPTAIKTIEWDIETPYKENGKEKIWHTKYAYIGPNQYAQWEEWDAGRISFVQDGTRAKEGKPGEMFGVHPGEVRELKTRFVRHPVGILMKMNGKPIATASDGRAIVFKNGDIAATLFLDPVTSRIHTIQFRDHFNGPVRVVHTEYSGYVSVNGVWLPTKWKTRVDNGDFGAEQTCRYTLNGSLPIVFSDARR